MVQGRTLLAALAVLPVALALAATPALARSVHRKRTTTVPAESCVVRTLPGSFVAAGDMYASASVADVVEVSCEPVYARAHVRVSANQLYNRCAQRLSWYPPYPSSSVTTGPGVSVQLDNDGNATVALIGGPSCAAGESLVSAHMEAAPYTTATTAFVVLAPQDGSTGIRISPEAKVEGETYGDVATIVQVAFAPAYAGQTVLLNASQLYSRCRLAPRLVWVTMGEEPGPGGSAAEPLLRPGIEEAAVRLDDDGNAFALLLGGGSCAAGSSLIEASLEKAPYTSFTSDFTIEPPVPGLGG